MTASALPPLSESVQMYLVSIARLREGDEPVSLSELAQELSVSPVSANEMCHKLQDQSLVIYLPYKGARLTEEGERRALYVLRRHRLWEVFLVEHLGLAYSQAHEAACHLEHSTPDFVIDRLGSYLGHPAVNPAGDLIPSPDGIFPSQQLLPLSELTTGEQGHVVRCEMTGTARAFLRDRGLRPGVRITVGAVTDSGLLVEIEGAEIALATSLAERVQVEPEMGKPESGNGDGEA